MTLRAKRGIRLVVAASAVTLSSVLTPAMATIEGIDPSSATLRPGESTSATVKVFSSSPGLCLDSQREPRDVSVSFVPPCNTTTEQSWLSTMKVDVGPSAPPGSHSILVIEYLDDNHSGKFDEEDPLADVREWPLTIRSISSPPPSPPPPPPSPPRPPPPVQELQDFSISCSPSALTTDPGGSGTSTCRVKSSGGFNKPVQLSCPTRPAGLACGFRPSRVTPPPNGSVTSALTINVAGDAQPGEFGFQVVGTAGSLTRRVSMKLVIHPPPAPGEPAPPPPPPPPRETGIALDRSSVEPGGELTATGRGCDPNSPVELFVANKPAGAGTANEGGEFEVPVKLPAEVGVGRHPLIATCGPSIETTVDVLVVTRAETSGASLTLLVVLIFLLLEARRLRKKSSTG